MFVENQALTMNSDSIVNPGERWVSLRRVTRAIVFATLGWIPWVLLCVPPHPGLAPGPSAAVFMLCLFAWSFLFCGIGSVICWRRESYAYSAARFPWRIALALNYGYFPAWLCLVIAAAYID